MYKKLNNCIINIQLMDNIFGIDDELLYIEGDRYEARNTEVLEKNFIMVYWN